MQRNVTGAYGRAEQEERALQAFEDVKANHPDVALDAAIYGKVLDVLAGKWKEEDDYQIDDLWMANATRDGREGEGDEDWDREWTDEWEGAGNVEQMALFEEQEAERRREEMRKKEEDRLRREAEEREREEREEEERKQKEREEREMSEMEKQRRREANAQYVDKAFALLEDMSRGRNIDPDYATFFKLMSLCLKRDNTTRALQVFDLFKREAVLYSYVFARSCVCVCVCEVCACACVCVRACVSLVSRANSNLAYRRGTSNIGTRHSGLVWRCRAWPSCLRSSSCAAARRTGTCRRSRLS
jgi:hypothetical protein